MQDTSESEPLGEIAKRVLEKSRERKVKKNPTLREWWLTIEHELRDFSVTRVHGAEARIRFGDILFCVREQEGQGVIIGNPDPQNEYLEPRDYTIICRFGLMLMYMARAAYTSIQGADLSLPGADEWPIERKRKAPRKRAVSFPIRPSRDACKRSRETLLYELLEEPDALRLWRGTHEYLELSLFGNFDRWELSETHVQRITKGRFIKRQHFAFLSLFGKQVMFAVLFGYHDQPRKPGHPQGHTQYTFSV